MLALIFMVALPVCISLNFCLHPSTIFFSISILQMEAELDKEVVALSENHPYIAMVVGGASLHASISYGRKSLSRVVKKGTIILTSLISVYFTFNMLYPKLLYPVLIFIQHFVLESYSEQFDKTFIFAG